jgi:branched-chain amino acid transport system ATP-binding protein
VFEGRSISLRFGAFTAVDGVDMSVPGGSIYGVIGPNGAGKTTLFDALSGFLRPSSGHITLDGKELTKAPVHERVAAGVVRTFQTPRLFDEMTVAEHLEVAACAHRRRLVNKVFASKSQRKVARSQVASLLERLGLTERAQTPCGDLDFGPRRLTEVGRALALSPRVLLLDEPVAGMNPTESSDFAELVRSLRDEGMTVAIIDHDVDFILDLCDCCTVLALGKVIASGAPEPIRSDPAVIDAYLGVQA